MSQFDPLLSRSDAGPAAAPAQAAAPASAPARGLDVISGLERVPVGSGIQARLAALLNAGPAEAAAPALAPAASPTAAPSPGSTIAPQATAEQLREPTVGAGTARAATGNPMQVREPSQTGAMLDQLSPATEGLSKRMRAIEDAVGPGGLTKREHELGEQQRGKDEQRQEHQSSEGREEQGTRQNYHQVEVDILKVVREQMAGQTQQQGVAIDRTQVVAPTAPATAVSQAIPENVAEVRVSVLDRIARSQGQVHLLSAEAALARAAVDAATPIQGRGDFNGTQPLRHDAHPETHLLREGRDATASRPAPAAEAGPTVGASTQPSWYADGRRSPEPVRNERADGSVGGAAAEASRPERRAVDRSAGAADRLVRMLRRGTDPESVKRALERVDNALLGVFWVAVVAALGADKITQAILRLIRSPREEGALGEELGQGGEQPQPEHGTACDGVDSPAGELLAPSGPAEAVVEPTAAALVGDIGGVVTWFDGGGVVAGVEVDAGSFGVVQSDERGAFLIRNVPLHAPYELKVRHLQVACVPVSVAGVCQPLTFVRIALRPAPR